MGLKLNEFHLESYSERSLLQTALHYFESERLKDYPEYKEALEALLVRLSGTECQEGGCPYCNADRAREEEMWRNAEDDVAQYPLYPWEDSPEMDDNP